MSTHAQAEERVEIPNVGVIIATYNYGQWLLEAITSAVLQDYPNKEIIIVDDGSTDNTEEIMQQLLEDQDGLANIGISQAALDKGIILQKQGVIRNVTITYIKVNNGGPARARNIALWSCESRCQLFAILDADDYWMPGKLSKSVGKILEAPETIGAVYTDNFTVNIETNQTSREFRESFDYNRLLSHNMVHSGCVINKLALSKVGFYDESLRVAEDYDLWLRIAEHYMIYHLPEPLVTIRAGGYNTTFSVRPEVWQKCWKRVYEKVQERHAKYDRN
jgi:glycosyltransferase involved in cell wall biosynthesis